MFSHLQDLKFRARGRYTKKWVNEFSLHTAHFFCRANGLERKGQVLVYFKKENTRTGNIPVLRGAFSILTLHLYSYLSILSMARWKTILVIDVEHDSSARGAVQNEQVCGIVCNYKQLSNDLWGWYALFPSNLVNIRKIVREMRPLPLYCLNSIILITNNGVSTANLRWS